MITIVGRRGLSLRIRIEASVLAGDTTAQQSYLDKKEAKLADEVIRLLIEQGMSLARGEVTVTGGK